MIALVLLMFWCWRFETRWKGEKGRKLPTIVSRVLGCCKMSKNQGTLIFTPKIIEKGKRKGMTRLYYVHLTENRRKGLDVQSRLFRARVLFLYFFQSWFTGAWKGKNKERKEKAKMSAVEKFSFWPRDAFFAPQRTTRKKGTIVRYKRATKAFYFISSNHSCPFHNVL